MAKCKQKSKIMVFLLFSLKYFVSANDLLEDCQNLRDQLLFGLDYPDRISAKVYSCIDKFEMQNLFKTVLQEKINKTITKDGPHRKHRFVMLSPQRTLPLNPADLPEYTFPTSGVQMLSNTMHVIRSTNVSSSIWDFEGGFEQFNEIVIEIDSTALCSDVTSKEIRVINAKSILEEHFSKGTANENKNMFIIIIAIIRAKRIPRCLKIQPVYERNLEHRASLQNNYIDFFKSASGKLYNPYLESTRIYHTTLEAAYPSYERFKNIESSTPPWVHDLGKRNSTWCRSHRFIMAFSELFFRLEHNGGILEFEATGPVYCNLLIYNQHYRAILMPFPSWNFAIQCKLWVRANTQNNEGDWWIEHISIVEIKDSRHQPYTKELKVYKKYGQTYYLQNINIGKWRGYKNTCDMPHLRIGLFAVEFYDYGVKYNFSTRT